MKQAEINKTARALVTLIAQHEFPVRLVDLAQMIEEAPFVLTDALAFYAGEHITEWLKEKEDAIR